LKLKFFGGVRTVTGSCFYIECNKLRIKSTVVCIRQKGMTGNRAPFDFQPGEIDYIFIACMDHSGMIQELLKRIQSRIITHVTRDLLELML
jgi:metallo-beta-lactamase family protein